MNQSHTIQARVYYEDTDAGGIVYHTSYLRYAERGRTELLRAAGFEHVRLLAEEGVLFAVTSIEARFRAPARLDDLLTVTSSVTGMTGARLDMEQEISRGGLPLVAMQVRLACLDKNGKAARLPVAIKEALASFPPSSTKGERG